MTLRLNCALASPCCAALRVHSSARSLFCYAFADQTEVAEHRLRFCQALFRRQVEPARNLLLVCGMPWPRLFIFRKVLRSGLPFSASGASSFSAVG